VQSESVKYFILSTVLLTLFAQAEVPPPPQAAAAASPGGIGRRVLDADYEPPADQLVAKKIKVAFFDADSTLRVAPSGSVSAGQERDVWILPLVSKKIAELQAEGYLVVIVSNQGGVPKNVSLEQADAALNFVRRMVAWLNPLAKIQYFDFAEKYDNDRKPNTGMMDRLNELLKAKFGAEIDKEKSFMCGDSAYKKGQQRPDGKEGTDFSDSDRGVAEKYGIKFIDPADLFEWRKYGYERFPTLESVDEFFERNPELRGKPLGPCPFPSLVPSEKIPSRIKNPPK